METTNEKAVIVIDKNGMAANAYRLTAYSDFTSQNGISFAVVSYDDLLEVLRNAIAEKLNTSGDYFKGMTLYGLFNVVMSTKGYDFEWKELSKALDDIKAKN